MPATTSTREVIIITQEFYPKRGGIGTYTEEMANAAGELGLKVEVWAPRTNMAEKTTWPFKVRRLPVNSHQGIWNSLRLIVEFMRWRRRLRQATVYLSEPGPMRAWMLVSGLKALRVRRLVLTFHGSEILRFYANPILRMLTRRLIRRADRIGTLTNYTRQLLCERFPEAVDKTLLTPGALRTDLEIKPHSPPADPDRKIIVLTVGRLHPRKGQLLTLRALQALPPAQRDQIEYWLAGSTSTRSYERMLRDAATVAGPAVRFLGDLSEEALDQTYAQADIFALTSIKHHHSVEGFGLVYLEASAHGLPVVAHTVGGVSEAIDEGRTGLLVNPDNQEELTNAFSRLLAEEGLRRDMGEAGRDWARRHTWTQAVEQLLT